MLFRENDLTPEDRLLACTFVFVASCAWDYQASIYFADAEGEQTQAQRNTRSVPHQALFVADRLPKVKNVSFHIAHAVAAPHRVNPKTHSTILQEHGQGTQRRWARSHWSTPP
jgi:hypothetical protein